MRGDGDGNGGGVGGLTIKEPLSYSKPKPNSCERHANREMYSVCTTVHWTSMVGQA